MLLKASNNVKRKNLSKLSTPMNTRSILSKKLCYCAVGSFALFSLSAFGQSSWNLNADGNWNTASNWSPAAVPNAIGAVVNFGATGGATKNVTLTSAITVGTINFTSSETYRITGTAQTLTLDVASGSAQINQTGGTGGVIQPGVTIALNDNLLVTGNSNAIFIQGAITGAHSLTLATGNLRLKGNTTYSGDTIITAGILQLGDGTVITGNIIGNSPNIIVNGGTLNQISSSEVIANSTNMTLNGGTWSLATNGLSETLNTLTLSANSTINMAPGLNTVATFAGGGIYNAGILTISNWSGSMTGGAAEQIVFGGPALSQTFLNNIFWATQNITGARQLASGEIVPVPEASNLLAGIGLAAAAVGYEMRRRKAKQQVEVVS